MSDWQTLADSRRNYGDYALNEEQVLKHPIEQFKRWLADISGTQAPDPTAMVLSTVDEQGYPDSRVVLLKGLENDAFCFYTNYDSDKARQLEHQAHAALNFYWPSMVRQVRVRGQVRRVSAAQSDAYFASRPRESQLSAIASPQSRTITDRHVLEEAWRQLLANQGDQAIVRPDNWGGYELVPDAIEFWQGRDNRLHDRLLFTRQGRDWSYRRLAP